MKYVWILFVIIAIEEIICNKIATEKKQFILYSILVLTSVILCMVYYSDEYNNSILGMINNKINLERFVWIK